MDGVPGTGPRKSGLSSSQGRVTKPASAEEAQQSNKDFASAADVKSAAPIAEASPSTQQKAVETPVFKPQARPLSERDVVDTLLKLQKSPTTESKQILTTMLQYGVEATEAGFEMIETLMKGKKKRNSIESAVISYSKELKESSKPMDLISSFLSQTLQLSKDIQSLRSELSQFSSFMKLQQKGFDQGLFSGIMSILSELEQELKKSSKKSAFDKLNLSKMKRGELFSTLKLFSEFMGGVEQKLGKFFKGNQQQMIGRFNRLKQQLGANMDALMGQFILSKEAANHPIGEDQYAFFQLPNPMAKTPMDIDILIKQEKKGKKASINTKKTRVVLKFETPELGEVSVIIDVAENKLWYVFQTDSGATKRYVAEMSVELRDRMETLNYQVVGVQTLKKTLDIKPLLLPVYKLDNLTRIVAEA